MWLPGDSMSSYIALTKPRITWLILMSTGVGYFFGARGGWRFLTLLHTIIGTGLIASGTAALNQWYEREADAKMKRTQGAPVALRTAVRLQTRWSLRSLISVAGFAELFLAVNPLTGWLGLFTLLSYLFVYTPLKQRSPHSTTIGAIPGAMPPLIGYAAASWHAHWDAWILFAILFFWQFPHFYAIAWMYREDYERAGIRMLPVVEPDGESTARRILLYSLILIPISLVPKYLAMTGNLYLIGALALGLLFSVRRRARELRSDAPTGPASAAGVGDLSAGFVRPDAFRSSGMKCAVPALCLALAACIPPERRCLPTMFPDFHSPTRTARRSTATRKNVWVADFIYTTCPGPCPRMTSQMLTSCKRHCRM